MKMKNDNNENNDKVNNKSKEKTENLQNNDEERNNVSNRSISDHSVEYNTEEKDVANGYDLEVNLKGLCIYPNVRDTILLEKDLISRKNSYKQRSSTFEDVSFSEEELSLSNIIKILKKKIKDRNIREVQNISIYLYNSGLLNKFRSDDINDIDFNKLLVQISSYIEYKFLRRNEVIFRKGKFLL